MTLAVLAGVGDPGARRGCWSPLMAGMAACLMAWSAAGALADRFAEAMTCLGVVTGPRSGRAYNGLWKALARQWRRVERPLKDGLREQALGVMRVMHQGWIVLAADGSRVELPRTRDNRRRFGTSDNGVWPQAYVTAIVHVLTGMVWDWRIGPARSSERGQLARMVRDLPENVLLLMDGYYVSYELWSALIEQGVHFLMRVGGNVTLIHDLVPGRLEIDRKAGIVYVWRQQKLASEPPLRLRLIRVGGKKRGVYLLTTVLDSALLSRHAAGEWYRRRWGIEVFYRSVKQIMGATKMGSRTATRARLELNWTMVAAAVLALMATRAIRGRGGDPSRWSFAASLRVVRRGIHEDRLGRGRRRRSIAARLAEAVKDQYRRSRPKRARHQPKTVNTPKPIKPPRMIRASKHLQLQARKSQPRFLAA